MMLLKQHNGLGAASAMTAARHGSVRRSGSTRSSRRPEDLDGDGARRWPRQPDVLVLERK
jgi:hypothetical protein